MNTLTVHRGEAPLVLTIPHAGAYLPEELRGRFVSEWLANKDADWWIDRLYAFGPDLGATVIRTSLSRSAIDMNRDPSGRELYPGLANTALCPLTTFDGESLYKPGAQPDGREIARRRERWFTPYHEAIERELARLRERFARVVLFDCHSIRSRIPRLFEGLLPNFNIGANDGRTCAPALTAVVRSACDRPPWTTVVDGRFKGGYTVRRHGRPETGVHAVQLEIAQRTYMHEPEEVSQQNWPAAFDPARAAPLAAVLENVLQNCVHWAVDHNLDTTS